MAKMNVKQIEKYNKNNTPFDDVVVLVHSRKAPYNNFGTLSDLSDIDFRGIKKLVVHDTEFTGKKITGVDEIELSPPTPLFQSQCKTSSVQLQDCDVRKVTAKGVASFTMMGSNTVEELNIRAARTIKVEETPNLAQFNATKTDLLMNYSVVNAPKAVLSPKLKKAVLRISMAEAEKRRVDQEKYAAYNASILRNTL